MADIKTSSSNNGPKAADSSLTSHSKGNPDDAQKKIDTNAGKQRDEGNDEILIKIYTLTAGDDEEDDDRDDMVSIGSMAVTTLTFKGNVATFASQTTLADVRVELAKVLNSKQTFKFCADDCAIISDDITLDAYKRTLRSEAFKKSTALMVFIATTNEPAASQASVLSSSSFVLKFIQMGATATDALNVGSLHSSAFKGKDPSAMNLGQLRRLIGKMSSNPSMHVFCSLDGTVAGDELTLQQYLNLDDAEVHPSDGTPAVIVRFRKHDAKVSAAASKFHGADADTIRALQEMKPNLDFKDRSGEEMHVDKTGFAVPEQLHASDVAARGATPIKYTSQMDEADWDMVLRNCCLLYGWAVDKRTKKVVRASTPAFRLKNKTPPQPHVIPVSPPAPVSSSEPDTTGEEVGEVKVVPVQPLTAEDIQAPIPTKIGAIPSYTINDMSRIEITAVTSEFQESMAKNHFSSSSIEGSISGGYAGVSAGVTAGAKSDKAGGGTETQKQFYKKMVGSYKFPRVDVFLRPEDLEPTEELRTAIEQVRRTKNINMLRKLYATFGHLFCPSVTLGGCLQTSKIVIGSETVAQSQDKEAFKAEVGIAVSSSWAKANVKGSHESQTSEEHFNRQMNSSETMAFEATGGNTILAADPPAWCSSVADFNTWRVINQAEVSPLVEAISQMAGYAEINSWFFSAIPKLSEYMVIPESRSLHVRFSVSAQDDTFRIITRKEEQAYLGHRPEQTLMPVRTSLQKTQVDIPVAIARPNPFNPYGVQINMTSFAVQADVTSTDALFYPHATKAPMLMFPNAKDTGTHSDATLSQSVWRLEIAQGHSIGSDTLICIKSQAAPSGVDLQLAVYRNAQGVFLPTITSNDEPCYWRLQRTSTSAGNRADRYMYGDEVRLTWSFSDQPSGFRDYFHDIYGRRNNGKPAEVTHDRLCLKMPFPRFEGINNDCIGLVMSTALTEEPILATFPIRQLSGEQPNVTRNYQMQDLRFRMDPVGNNGRGDADDYMNLVTDGSSQVIKVDTIWGQFNITGDMRKALEEGGPEAVLARNALGPLGYATGGVSSLVRSVMYI